MGQRGDYLRYTGLDSEIGTRDFTMVQKHRLFVLVSKAICPVVDTEELISARPTLRMSPMIPRAW